MGVLRGRGGSAATSVNIRRIDVRWVARGLERHYGQQLQASASSNFGGESNSEA